MVEFEEDPFGEDNIPDAGPYTPSPRRITPGPARKKGADLETKTRDWLREQGYVYGRTEQIQTLWNPLGGPGFVKKDLFGFVDGIAVREGELILVQTTSRSNRAAHLKKMVDGTFRIGAGQLVKCSTALLPLLTVPGVRVTLFLWDQPGGPKSRWRLEQVDVTREMVEEVIGRRRKVA